VEQLYIIVVSGLSTVPQINIVEYTQIWLNAVVVNVVGECRATRSECDEPQSGL